MVTAQLYTKVGLLNHNFKIRGKEQNREIAVCWKILLRVSNLTTSLQSQGTQDFEQLLWDPIWNPPLHETI